MKSDAGPGVYNGLTERQTVPVSGPERHAGLPPCPTRCQGRSCGKRVAHKYADGWRCISCGVIREVPADG
jgi:hypothetical protein